jgi:hypothetical protein
MSRTPFDPIAPLATVFHDDAHRGEACPWDAASCPQAATFAIELRARLAGGGLAIAPTEVVDWIVRLFEDASDDAVVEAAPSPGASDSERRSREMVWVRLRHPAGAPTRLGPYQRWLGELVLGDISFSHGPDVIGAIIEPEPAWIGELLGSLGA